MKSLKDIQGDLCHRFLRDHDKPTLTFREDGEYVLWRKQIKEKFLDLLGINKIIENCERHPCSSAIEIQAEVQKEGYKQIRFVFESEVGAIVPCYLLIPDGEKEKYPIAIVLQGHSSGFHNSIAEPKNEEEVEYATGRGSIAVQAVRRGYAALAIEQRGMGERRPPYMNANMCEYSAHIALLLGRTIIGERIWDVHKAIDALKSFSQCDMENILITGGSGGGTASFYATCFDERIKLAAPVCAFCTYQSSIMNAFHCACNFIPRAYEWFEMEDLSCLIAPRKLLVVAGQEDKIFPIEGVEKSFATTKKIYEKANAIEKCRMVVTPKGHYWCEDIVWDSIARFNDGEGNNG